MFETTAVVSRRRGWRATFWGMLPFSIAAHVMAGLATILVQTWDVTFPSSPPAKVEAYRLMVALALPPPPPPPPPAAAAPASTEPREKPPENVAPVAIPEAVPDLLPPPSEPTSGAADGVEGGVEGGEIGGVVGGTEGGVMPPGPPPAPPDTIVVPRDEKLPLKPLSMNYPIYPDKWCYRNVEDQLVLRYHIDKKGRVVDVVILRPPRFPEFAEASIAAVRSWRFRPLTINGEPKEVLHELTVNFRIERPEQLRRRPAEATRGDAPVPPGAPGPGGMRERQPGGPPGPPAAGRRP